jgi:NhaA family Na+:H+ antiporter
LLGKQLGVFTFAWLAIRLRLARLPTGVRWWHLYAVAVLAGIGFTMSLFIAGLAFNDPAALTAARQGVLLASAIAALVGAAVLAATLPRGHQQKAGDAERLSRSVTPSNPPTKESTIDSRRRS